MSEPSKDNIAAYKKHVESKFKDAYFEAMMSFQNIESLLKDCIKKSYEILNKNGHKSVRFVPNDGEFKRLSRKGLGGLIAEFRKITVHEELCDSIASLTEERNNLAHVTAGEFIENIFQRKALTQIDKEATDLNKLAQEASNLFLSLANVYEDLLSE